MKWNKPTVVEICVGMEVTSYESAEIDDRCHRSSEGAGRRIAAVSGRSRAGHHSRFGGRAAAFRSGIAAARSAASPGRAIRGYARAPSRASPSPPTGKLAPGRMPRRISASRSPPRPSLHPRDGPAGHSPIAGGARDEWRCRPCRGPADACASASPSPFRDGGDARGACRKPVFDVMAPAVVQREAVASTRPFEPLPGLAATLFAVPGKVPLWLERRRRRSAGEAESTRSASCSRRRPAHRLYSGLRPVTERHARA